MHQLGALDLGYDMNSSHYYSSDVLDHLSDNGNGSLHSNVYLDQPGNHTTDNHVVYIAFPFYSQTQCIAGDFHFRASLPHAYDGDAYAYDDDDNDR